MNTLFLNWHEIAELRVTRTIETKLEYLTGLFIDNLMTIPKAVISCLKQLAVKTRQTEISNMGRFNGVLWIADNTIYQGN